MKNLTAEWRGLKLVVENDNLGGDYAEFIVKHRGETVYHSISQFSYVWPKFIPIVHSDYENFDYSVLTKPFSNLYFNTDDSVSFEEMEDKVVKQFISSFPKKAEDENVLINVYE